MEYDLIKNTELEKQTQIIDEIMSKEGVIVLCKNKYCRTIIDEQYSKMPDIYYEYYIKSSSDDYLSLRKNMLDIEEEAAYNQLIGILMYEAENNIYPGFRKELLFKGYKWLYRDIKNSYACDISKILSKLIKRNGGSKLKKDESFEAVLISLQIASIEKKPLNISSFDLIQEICSFSTEALELARGDYLQNNKTNRLYEFFPKECLNVKKFETISEVVSYISADTMNDPIMSDSMMYFDNFLNSIGLDSFSIVDVPYTEEDIKIMTQFLNYDNGYILSNDSKKVIISAIYIILALKKKYFDAKTFTLKTNMDKEYKNLLTLKSDFKSKEDSYLKQIELLEKELNAKNNKISELESELSIALNKNKKLEQELFLVEDNSKEVLSLREAIYSMETEDYIEASVSINDKIKFINEFKISVFGGTESWIKSHKDILSEVKFIRDDSKNIDISFVKNMDFVFINVKNLSHSFYYKIINTVKKNNAKLFYINESNKDILIDRMFNLIKYKGE